MLLYNYRIVLPNNYSVVNSIDPAMISYLEHLFSCSCLFVYLSLPSPCSPLGTSFHLFSVTELGGSTCIVKATPKKLVKHILIVQILYFLCCLTSQTASSSVTASFFFLFCPELHYLSFSSSSSSSSLLRSTTSTWRCQVKLPRHE